MSFSVATEAEKEEELLDIDECDFVDSIVPSTDADDDIIITEAQMPCLVAVADHVEERESTELRRNPCLAHLLQLAIKDAIKASSLVTAIVTRINKIVRFFHKSTFFYSELKAINGNLGLLKPCITRWNAQFACINRILHRRENKVSPVFVLSSRGW